MTLTEEKGTNTMSNHLYIQSTKFVDLDSEGVEIETTFGFRIYDDYDKSYINFGTSREEMIKMSPKEIVEFMIENNEEAGTWIKYHTALNQSIFVNDIPYRHIT